MSAVESTIRSRPRIPAATKAAIIAALGSGCTQAQAAQRFKVHPNTVHALWKIVKQDQHPSNVANLDWKSQARVTAQNAVMEGMEQRKDVISAANIGLKVLYGIGDLVQGSNVQVAGNVALTVSWMPMVEDTTRTIDATVTSVEPTTDKGLSEATETNPT